ncbi:MAG: CDP-alcohol phosphatidyltransferase family protein [Acetivibrionales bacterium]|jgi:cardiolipin synthase|nr:CDP-diacylglycerol--glycerol-3-phosphate 3-phosphatidyltransferase [Clostridiaceae bacterium]
MSIISKNIPNILTVLRMAAVPVFVVFMQKDMIYPAIVIFLLAEFTDVLDGIIARRFNLITTFGKIADPLADKMMQLAALFMFSIKEMIPKIIPWLVLFKELFLLISGIYLYRKKFDMSSKWFGKLTSVIMFIAIMLVFFDVPRYITDVIFWICVGMALFAALMYIRNYFNQVNAAKEENKTK